MNLHWRQATASDLSEIDSIANRIHTGLPERPEVLAEKLRLFPHGALVLDAADRIAGYGLSHPWKLCRVPALNAFLHALPADANCIHIHDVAILSEWRGRRAAASYIDIVSARASGMNIRSLALVSVYQTAPLWAQLGFRPIAADDEMSTTLRTYGHPAQYMIRDLQ